MQIKMNPDNELLDEVVVVGYGTVKKDDLTGSVSAIKPDEFNRGAKSTAQDALVGKVAGVNVVSSSGAPGSGSTIRIRSGASLSASNDPLIVIDGVPVDNSSIEGGTNLIGGINPNDIETFTVLKDASATAIYGSRASNGVIVITTKKGTKGKPKFNYSSNYAVSTTAKRLEVLTADEFRAFAPTVTGVPENVEMGKSNTNWQDEIFQTAFITNNNISITGASPKHSFYLGVGYSHEQGNIKHEKFSKVTINASNDYKITDFLKVGFQFNGARTLPADSKQVLGALRATPIAPVYNKEYGLYSVLPEFQKAQINNPMVDVELKANTTKAENYRASGNIYGEVDFLKHFTFKAMFSMDYASNNGRTYLPIMKVYDDTAAGDVVTLGTGKTEVSQFKENETKVQSDYLLTYTNSFDNGNHNLTATAGFTTYYNSLSRLLFLTIRTNGLSVSVMPQQLPTEVPNGSGVRYPCWHV